MNLVMIKGETNLNILETFEDWLSPLLTEDRGTMAWQLAAVPMFAKNGRLNRAGVRIRHELVRGSIDMRRRVCWQV